MSRALKSYLAWVDRDWQRAGFSPAGSVSQPLLWLSPVLLWAVALNAFDIPSNGAMVIAGLVLSLLLGIALMGLSFVRLYRLQRQRKRDEGNGS